MIPIRIQWNHPGDAIVVVEGGGAAVGARSGTVPAINQTGAAKRWEDRRWSRLITRSIVKEMSSITTATAAAPR